MEEGSGCAFGSLQSMAVAKLDRKRATDRRAQRAARERRQQYIDSLHQQIEALSGMPHDQVQDFFQTNERLRAENEHLRHKSPLIIEDRSENDDSAISAIDSPSQLQLDDSGKTGAAAVSSLLTFGRFSKSS